MKIAVFGLGYVGAVLAGGLAARGHSVYGVDVDPYKVDAINAGRSPFHEPGLAEQLRIGCEHRLISCSFDAEAAVRNAEVIFICVGTYTRWNGRPDFHGLLETTREVARHLKDLDGYRVVAVRSTALPETVEKELLPELERTSGKRVPEDVGFVFNPEFLREGSAVHDFASPALIVVGGEDSRSRRLVRQVYAGIAAPIIETNLRAAALIKYVCNSFHALKIAFANEIGNVCRLQGIDPFALMEAVCKDHHLNISPAYLRPGFAFGGSCLCKDLQALIYEGKQDDLRLPLLEAILPSNDNHFKIWLNAILESGKKRVGLIGLTFKPGTDDLRQSPLVELAETLYGKGLHLAIYDRHFSLSSIYGSNLQYLKRHLPHVSQLLVPSFGQLLEHSDLIVIGHNLLQEEQTLLQKYEGKRVVIDLNGSLNVESTTDSLDLRREATTSTLVG